MRKVKFEKKNEVKINNIKGYMKRKVVVSGTSAKVTCPKEYLGCEAVLVILEDEIRKRGKKVKKDSE